MGNGLYQFFFKRKDTVEFILSNGPWSVDDYLLLLTPWWENFMGEVVSFIKIDFWIQVTRLPEEWYSSRIGKKLFCYLNDCHYVELQIIWASHTKFYRIRVSV